MARTVQEGRRMTKPLKAIIAAIGCFGAGSSSAHAAKPNAPAGVPLRLVITRKTDRTCAKEVVIKDLGIDRPLPLDQPVTVDITPKKTGQLRYACGMDMVSGAIVVQ